MTKFFYLAALALACTAAQADWVLPSGASASLGGGTASLGCANVHNAGTLALDGGTLVAARDVQVAAGAQLQIGSGWVELAQQWSNQGSVTATSGGALRTASPGCPVAGAAGPVQTPSTPTPVPATLPGGGMAQVGISGMPPGCTLTSLAINTTIPLGAPANATFPLGVLHFTAKGCPGATLAISITYPHSLAGLTVQKFGPHGSAPRATGWYTPADLVVNGSTVTYTVADNGDGDNDPTPGTITDPLAPMLLAAPPPGPGGTHAIPTLGEWGLLLLSALMGLLGLRRSRSSAPTPQGHRPFDF